MGCTKTIVGTALLPGIGTMLGMGADAQDKATKDAKNAQYASMDMQERMYNQQRDDFKPYSDMGTQGVKDYNAFKADPNAYMNSPAYQWQQGQIDKQMNRQLSARGRSNSSYGMNSLANAYGNLGAQEYQNAYNRMLDPIKIGQNAAGSTGQAAQNYSNAYGQTQTNIGNISQQDGQNQASLYSNIAALPLQLMGAYGGFQNNMAQANYYNKKG